MRRWLATLGVLLPLAGAQAQQRPATPAPAPAPAPTATPAPGVVPPGGAPHGFLFGTWTGGLFPAADNEGATCFGQPSVVFTRDVVLRVSLLDVAYRQRLVETVQQTPNGVEFRLVPAQASVPPVGGRMPPDAGFGCADPDGLRVVRTGPDEITFPDCADFPSPLRRCLPAR